MPPDKPFQFGLRSLMLVMAAVGPCCLWIVRWVGPVSFWDSWLDGDANRLFAGYGPLLMAVFGLGAAVSTAVVVPLLLIWVHARRWIRRRHLR